MCGVVNATLQILLTRKHENTERVHDPCCDNFCNFDRARSQSVSQHLVERFGPGSMLLQRQPWIFYSKGMNKHVTELPEEKIRHPFTTKKWPLVRRNPLRQNDRNKSYHLHLHPRRLSCRSINGNGMIFLPLDTSMKRPARSRRRCLDHFFFKTHRAVGDRERSNLPP